MIAPLAAATDAGNFGGKAARLAVARADGLPVPDGFCVSWQTMSALDDVAADIERAHSELSADRVAVRSSALDEDGTGASFAGIHTSILGSSAGGVLAALEKVRDSARSPAAMAYRSQRGITAEPRMAALVQSLVAADVSGVVFTRHPVTRDERMVVEATWGLGEALVSGLVTPDHAELMPDGVLRGVQLGDKEAMVVLGDEGSEVVSIPGARRYESSFDAIDLAALASLAQKCEKLFGAPQDVEWAFARGQLWLLQSRPITT